MTSFFPLPSSTSSFLSFGEDSLRKSCASAASARSCGTVRYRRLGYVSTDSLSSGDPIQDNKLQRYPRDVPFDSESSTDATNSSVQLEALDEHDAFADCYVPLGSSSALSTSATSQEVDAHARSGLEEYRPENSDIDNVHAEEDEKDRVRTRKDMNPDRKSYVTTTEFNTQSSKGAEDPYPFRRWLSRLRRRNRHPQTPSATMARADRWSLDDIDQPRAKSPLRPHRSSHRKSDSQASSLGFVQAVKSATETLASTSIATMSRGNRKWLSQRRRSSAISGSNPRASPESRASSVDEVARQRSYRRRQKLEELVSTEENYLADLRVLYNAYSTILAHHPTRVSFVRITAKRTLADLLHLHHAILGQLHCILPFAEYDRSVAKAPGSVLHRSHVRWHSVDVVPPRPTRTQAVLATIRQGRRSLNLSRSSSEEGNTLSSSPQTVASVAEIFAQQMHRLDIYEEYGVNYDLLQRDIDESQQSISMWQDFDRAIEALSAHASPIRSQDANNKRAMTVKDLLIKPIQRLPRYELLFGDLRKLTPACDDPEAYDKLTALLTQLNQTCRRMNEAKHNPQRARMLQTTFLIEDRLTFSCQIPRSVFSQLLGHVKLCGCLYIAYRGKERIKGRYVICVLFQSTLLLACDEEDEHRQKYRTLAGISLATATIEETDNARGLQCHTAPYAWKVVFEHSARMFELVLVACSALEVEVWRKHISAGIQNQSQAVSSGLANVFELQSPLTAEMRSVGKAFGKPGSFVRRMSVHRTATVGPTTDLNQVIIKNTQAVKEVQDGSSQHSLPIARSQSTGTPGHVQTLAPRRAERHRLETLLADVWTRDLLPYPRMVRRSDPLRASANNVIRKFSMASISSNFSSSKRSASYTSIKSWRKEDVLPPKSKRFGSASQYSRGPERSSQSQIVNLHTAPEAFLPEDFELHEPSTTRKNSATRALTLTTDCHLDLLLENESIAAGLRRARSIRGGVKRILTPVPPAEKSLTPGPRRPSDGTLKDQNQDTALRPSHDTSDKQDRKANRSPKKAKSMHRLFRIFATDNH